MHLRRGATLTGADFDPSIDAPYLSRRQNACPCHRNSGDLRCHGRGGRSGAGKQKDGEGGHGVHALP